MKNKYIELPKSKYESGYTRKEVLDIIRPLKIHHRTFWSKFGINTCAIEPKTGQTLYYGCDILRTIACCKENRDIYSWEWD